MEEAQASLQFTGLWLGLVSVLASTHSTGSVEVTSACSCGISRSGLGQASHPACEALSGSTGPALAPPCAPAWPLTLPGVPPAGHWAHSRLLEQARRAGGGRARTAPSGREPPGTGPFSAPSRASREPGPRRPPRASGHCQSGPRFRVSGDRRPSWPTCFSDEARRRRPAIPTLPPRPPDPPPPEGGVQSRGGRVPKAAPAAVDGPAPSSTPRARGPPIAGRVAWRRARAGPMGWHVVALQRLQPHPAREAGAALRGRRGWAGGGCG